MPVQALANATGRAPAKVKADYEVEGDLGTVAAKARATQKTMFASKPLTVQAVLKCAHVLACSIFFYRVSHYFQVWQGADRRWHHGHTRPSWQRRGWSIDGYKRI